MLKKWFEFQQNKNQQNKKNEHKSNRNIQLAKQHFERKRNIKGKYMTVQQHFMTAAYTDLILDWLTKNMHVSISKI